MTSFPFLYIFLSLLFCLNLPLFCLISSPSSCHPSVHLSLLLAFLFLPTVPCFLSFLPFLTLFPIILSFLPSFSLGNYGNKLDQSVPPSSSTTPPTNAVYDGSYYYYLPWGNTKPCVSVDSHWEDIAFRLDSLNILTRLCERLVSSTRFIFIHTPVFNCGQLACVRACVHVCVCACVCACVEAYDLSEHFVPLSDFNLIRFPYWGVLNHAQPDLDPLERSLSVVLFVYEQVNIPC